MNTLWPQTGSFCSCSTAGLQNGPENNSWNHFRYPKTSTQATLRQDKLQILLAHSESTEGQWPAQQQPPWQSSASSFVASSSGSQNLECRSQASTDIQNRYSTLNDLIVSLYFLLVMVYFIENTPTCGTLVSTSSSETKKGVSLASELPRVTIINLWFGKVWTDSVSRYL